MDKKPGQDERGQGQPGPRDDEGALRAREEAVANRETRVGVREKASSEHDDALTEREQIIRLEEEALRARAEADDARTERERLLVQMKEANEKLVLATVRADELADEAIAARSREAASNRVKDEFLAMLGHELRNPLAPILTALHLISMGEHDEFEREHTIIGRQVRHLVRLVDDLLDISRITSGKIELHRQPVELAEVVSRAVEMASPLLETKAHELRVEVSSRGLAVDGDATRLAQAIGNVLTNAAKYTPARGSIVVAGERRDAIVSLRIRDTGIGISREMLPHVFELFTQERQALDRAGGGLGLGLAIVRTLIGMHGGTVTARSEGADRGSEFVIELPAAVTPQDEAGLERPSPIADSVPARVLLVDDNRDAAELTAETLTQFGHDVRVAFDGPSAISIVAGFVPDVVLLDIGLPVMDGYEVAARLRTMLAPYEPRFIAITGYGQAPNHQRSRDAGFDTHLVKPADVATLRDSIQASMRRTSR